MAESRFAPDRRLSVRMASVMGLLVLAYAAALAVLYFVLGRAWPLGVAAVAAFLFFQLATGDKIALAAVGAREVTAEEDPELHAVVDRLCALADMDKPRLAVLDSRVPNAFAIGRSRRRVTLCVSRGLRDKLDEAELEGVLAHELSHVAHGDAVVMTVASFVGVLAGLTARLGARLMFFAGRARGAWQFLAVALAVTALSAVTWFISLVLIRALSRYRELAADRAAAVLTGNPAAIGSALAKISGPGALIPREDLRRAAVVGAFAFCPVAAPPSKRGGNAALRARRAALFSTHPTVEARLEQLARITQELGH
jgi:heat shock protein HtpX